MENVVKIPFSKGKNILVDKFRYENGDKNILTFLQDTDSIEQIFAQIKDDVYMVLGWDGTILRAINETQKDNIPYIPINFWSKWFLLNSQSAIEFLDGFSTRKFPLLDIEVVLEDGKKLKSKAFNEVQIKAWGWQMIDTDVIIGEHTSINLRGDGLLVVTPAGSTGYNRSARGPVLPHNSNTFIITPLLTFEPKAARPVVFPNKQKVVVRKNNSRKPELSVFADATTILKDYTGEVEILVKKSKQKIKLLIANNYLAEFDNKIYAEQGFSVN